MPRHHHFDPTSAWDADCGACDAGGEVEAKVKAAYDDGYELGWTEGWDKGWASGEQVRKNQRAELDRLRRQLVFR
jgi:hypothetical protein